MHVTPDEVGKLQRVARAQGGSLTVNPDTGLPEANFFSDLNPLNPNSAISKTGVAPLLVGAALGPAGFGLTAAEAGLAYGGISALSSGDLGKGLMAGLGAYGGAGLAAGLSGMGASALASDPSSGFYANSMDRASDLASNMQGSAASGASFADKLGAGASYAASNPKDALAALGSGNLMKGAGILGAATAPILAAKMVKTTTQPPAQTPSLIRPYTYTARPTTPTNMVGTQYRPGEDTSERNWMTGNFTAQTPYKAPGPEYAAEGGVIKMAEGGVPDLYGNLQKYAYNPSTVGFDPSAGSVNYGRLPRYRFNPVTGRFEIIPASVDASVDASVPSNTNGAYNDVGGGGSGGDTGGNSTSSSSGSTGQGISGTATGLGLGMMSIADSISSISPMAAAVIGSIGGSIADSQADAMGQAMDALGSISAMGSQGVNGVSAVSDAQGNVSSVSNADAVNAADAAAVSDSSSDSSGNSSGSSSSSGDSSGSSSSGDGGSGSSGSSGDGGSGSGSGGDGGGSGGDARGGFYHNGQFNYHPHMAYGGLAMLASGGLGSLGGYSDGGRLLRGPGDGVSDSIPAQIGNHQPARLADGEFVVPARIVSELGNGSTEAGARQLYKMMDRVQKARAKTTGKQKLAKNTNAAKYLPA
jgi:hypothetical protein